MIDLQFEKDSYGEEAVGSSSWEPVVCLFDWSSSFSLHMEVFLCLESIFSMFFFFLLNFSFDFTMVQSGVRVSDEGLPYYSQLLAPDPETTHFQQAAGIKPGDVHSHLFSWSSALSLSLLRSKGGGEAEGW